MPGTRTAVAARLDADRKGLLDLSLRNPLLNYRPRARGLEGVGELPSQLFRVLVREGRRLTFLGAPGLEATAGLGQPGEEAPARPLTNQEDCKIQTDLPSDQLQARLLATYHAARTSLEEQGVTTLFLALGMLAWKDEADRLLRAPLVLVPVALERSGARERFHLRQAEEEPGGNLSLAEKLRAEFGLALPGPSEEEDLDVDAYFDAVAAVVADRDGWTVERGAVVLGFFAFGKFLMYRDLEDDAWPVGARPADHPIVGALLGDGFGPESSESAGEPGDSGRFEILDADGSQVQALADVAGGRTLVIQGPPGTGKSQTIANLIAGAIGRGRSVLFVAEKMAALEVVKSRLDGAGLGAACLELHSHKTSKKAVLDELRRTLDLATPAAAPTDDDARLLGEARDRLDAYCEAIGTPVAASGVSPQRAVGEVLRLRADRPESPPPPMIVPAMEEWTALEFRRALALVEQLQARLVAVAVGSAREHPFWGSRRAALLPADGDAIRAALLSARRASDAAREAAGRLATALGLDAPGGPSDSEGLLRASRWVAKAAQAQGANLASAEWLTRREEMHEALDAGTALAEIRTRLEATLLPVAWDQDLRETRQALDATGRHWWRFLSGRYRRAKARMTAICRSAPPADVGAQVALIDSIQEAGRKRETLRDREALATSLFGPRWQGERSNWEALTKVAKWAARLHLDVRKGRLPAAVITIVGRAPATPRPAGLAKESEEALDARRDALRRLADLLEFDAPARFAAGTALEDLAFEESDALLKSWSERLEELPRLVALNHLAGRCREAGLGPVVEAALTMPEAGTRLADAFGLRWFECLLARAFRERPALAGFDGEGHDRAIRDFRDLDRLALRHNRARLALEHRRGLPRHEGGGQLAVLRREFEKKSRHLPVRKLLERAGLAVRAIKPVFLMSPMSVAAYLAPGAPKFDLVVFDEASQVRPADALGALLRAGQAVVVGDEKQLPPTSFFDRLTSDADSDGDDEDEAGEVESLLGLFSAQGAPRRLLRWHYRSRHESLIAVSNREFYDGRLVVFPGPDADRRDAGLVLRYLPDTTYDRGNSRTNPGEADAVARAVMEHARTRGESPRLTLGVAAFSVAQVQAIRDRLEVLRREDPSCEAFFATGQPEPFFVKNLENVQGDERDVIFISVGYGRDADGGLALNFGPLNAEGGERRLNVLITRARLRCEVFTNLRAEDVDTQRARSRGVRALKTFLAYARDGEAPVPPVAASEPDSPVGEAVAATLAGTGHAVRRKVGPEGSAIDFAVVDPARPGRYLLGIEGDGPAYHDARPARDRDRLRPQVLEGLGWRLHRTWSADWLRDPVGERARLRAALDAATAPAPAQVQAPAVAPEPEPEPEPRPPADCEPASVPTYRLAAPVVDPGDTEVAAVSAERFSGWVAEVVEVEGPVHVAEVARRIADAAGAKRLGSRVQAAVERAAADLAGLGKVQRRGEFLWPAAMVEPEVRDRSALPAPSRRLDLVAPEEIARAVERVVADAFGMEPAAVPAAACRLLGFPRLGDDMRARFEEVLADLLGRGLLERRGEFLVHRDLRVAC